MDETNSALVFLFAKIIVTSIIVIILLVALLRVFLSFYVEWFWSSYVEDTRAISTNRRGSGRSRKASQQRQLNRATLLGSLPIVEYEAKEFQDELECAVCLSKALQGEKIRLMPKCNHGFHVDCIDAWFQTHSTCPLCRNLVLSYEHPTTKFIEVQGTSGDRMSLDDDLDDEDDHTSADLIQLFGGKFVMI